MTVDAVDARFVCAPRSAFVRAVTWSTMFFIGTLLDCKGEQQCGISVGTSENGCKYMFYIFVLRIHILSSKVYERSRVQEDLIPCFFFMS